MNYISKNELDDCIQLAKEYKRLYDAYVLIGVSVGVGYPYRPEIQMAGEDFVETFTGDGEWVVDEEADYYRKQVVIEDVTFFALFDREAYEYEKVQEDR